MALAKIKEFIFKYQYRKYYHEYLSRATYFTGVRVTCPSVELDVKFRYSNEKLGNVFSNNSLKNLLQLADRIAAHEAGEFVYDECVRVTGEKRHRILGEFVGEYFGLVLRKKIRKNPLFFKEHANDVYEVADELVNRISTFSFEKQILFLQSFLFGKPHEDIEKLVETLEERSSKYRY